MKLRSLRLFSYTPLLRFVNEPLTTQNWRTRLDEEEAFQLEWELGLEASETMEYTPKIGGVIASFEGAQKLQASIRKQLNRLVRLCSDPQMLATESENPGRGGGKAWTWRKALVLPTRQMFFEDAGEALNYLVEALEHEIKQRERAKRGTDTTESRWSKGGLHLSLCACGCRQFFLWEGNWKRKKRKFLDDKHRMGFHNAQNVKRKRLLARQRREQGDPRYFGIPRKEQHNNGRL